MKIRIILVEPEHEGNIGSVARAMKNFGLSDLWIVNPKTEIGSLTNALASHAKDTIQKARIVGTIKEATEGCGQIVGTTAISGTRPSNILRTTLSPEEYAHLVESADEQIGLVFGRESLGLSNKELDGCDALITIPTCAEYKTLNVAMACTVILYELHKHLHHVERTIKPADSETRKRLIRLFQRLTDLTKTPKHRRRMATRAFRNLLSRGLPSKRETLLLMGILRRACHLAEKESTDHRR